MLRSLDGNQVNGVPHGGEFEAVKKKLQGRLAELRADLDRIIEGMPPDCDTGRRTFSSSFLGSKLSPWPYPLAHIYDVSREILGKDAEGIDVETRASLIFGLFVWESIMNREEEWVFYDPNLSSNDPNRDITGKVYFEQSN